MAAIGIALQIGRSALAAYQAAIAITGQNIANVGNPDYTRQSGRLSSLYGSGDDASMAAGIGVGLSLPQRHLDAAVQARLRLALGARSGAEVSYQVLSRVEAMYNELTDYDLSSQLSDLLTTLGSLQVDPLEPITRTLAVAKADALATTFRRHRAALLDQVGDLNGSVVDMTRKANALAGEVARLNEMIVTAEARSPGSAGALRDRRDSLLGELAELMDIQTREQESGAVNIYIGSEPLIEVGRSRGLSTRTNLEDGLERVTVCFADNGGTVQMHEGRLAATLSARDVHLVGQLDKLDRLAAALIFEINRVQTSGRGLVGYTAVTGTYTVGDPEAPLSDPSAGLPFPVRSGTFLIHVQDQTSGQSTSHLLEVDLDGLGREDTTLASLAAALDDIPGLRASVTADNRLTLTADPGYEFFFSDDTSGALAALGLATFFDGTDASTIAVSAAVRSDPQLIAASASGAPGDGTNAGRLAAVGARPSDLLGGLSILDFHESLVATLAVEVASASSSREAADAVYSSLLAQREAISGVSLDEEAINLTKYERSFQGACRFLTVVDGLVDEILALVS